MVRNNYNKGRRNNLPVNQWEKCGSQVNKRIGSQWFDVIFQHLLKKKTQ